MYIFIYACSMGSLSEKFGFGNDNSTLLLLWDDDYANFWKQAILCLIIGFCGMTFTALSTVVLREYLPVNWSGFFNGCFALSVSIGMTVSALYQFEWMRRFYFIVLWIPGVIALFSDLVFLFFFYVESPKKVFIDLVKRRGTSERFGNNILREGEEEKGEERELISGDHDSEDGEIGGDADTIDDLEEDEESNKRKVNGTVMDLLYKDYCNDNRIIKFMTTFYSEDNFPVFLEESFSELEKTVIGDPDQKDNEAEMGIWKLCFSKKYRKQFFVCCVMNSLNQLTGIICINMYSSNIFYRLGFINLSNLISLILSKCLFSLRLRS